MSAKPGSRHLAGLVRLTTVTVSLAFAVEACRKNDVVFVPGPSPGPDEALFVVSERPGSWTWRRSEAAGPEHFDGDDGQNLFLVLVRESDLRSFDPRVPSGAIESVDLRLATAAECAGHFSTGAEERRGIPLALVDPDVYHLDLATLTLGRPPQPSEFLARWAVEVPWVRPCVTEQLELTAIELPSAGRIISASTYAGDRVAVLNGDGQLMLYNLRAPASRLATVDRTEAQPGTYVVRALQVCPQNGRQMLYVSDGMEPVGGQLEARVARFDVSEDSFDAAQLLSEDVVREFGCQGPDTLVGAGPYGLIVSSTASTAFQIGAGGPTDLSFEGLDVLEDSDPPMHFLAGGDGRVYRGRIDRNEVEPMAQVTFYGLRRLVAIQVAERTQVWVTDSNESIHQVQVGQGGRQVDQLLRLPPEVPDSCWSRTDACGDRLSGRGFNHVTSLSGPAGQTKLVFWINDCPGLLVVDPENLCSYGIDLSAYGAAGAQPRTAERHGSEAWVSTERTLVRLAWPRR